MAEPQVVTSGDEPVAVSGKASPADASQPSTDLENRYHTYESNPVPWWLTIIWVSFLVFGFVYLIANLMGQ